MDMLREMVGEDICKHVSTDLGNGIVVNERDKPWWMPNSIGNFTVGSAWKMVRQRKDKQHDIMVIWEKGITFRVSFLLWRMWFKRIPIGEVLDRCKIVDPVVCVCCSNSMAKTFDHLFVACPDANFLWRSISGAAGIYGPYIQLKQHWTNGRVLIVMLN
ncbi:hypothetical protein KY289_020492 [Solanum tuberosum]|nr:hypothetical protein KY289_020492 [Solanum tuberosum]